MDDHNSSEKLPRNELKLKNNDDLSYFKYISTKPLKNNTIGELLKEAVFNFGERTAINSYYQNSKLTFKEVYDKITAFAAGLLALGLEKGDHVGIWAPNCMEWYISFLAVMDAGLVAVNLNPLYECLELEAALKKADIKALIMGGTLKNINFYYIVEKIIPDLSSLEFNVPVNCNKLPFLKILIYINNDHHRGTFRWHDVPSLATTYHKGNLQKIQQSMNNHDVCNMQFTSGTTGTAKIACITHFSLVNGSYYLGQRMLLSGKPHVACCQAQFFHSFGTTFGILFNLQFGTTLVLPSPKFSAQKSAEAIMKERCTIIYGTPTMYIDLVSTFDKLTMMDAFSGSKTSLQMAVIGGSSCNPDLFGKMARCFNFEYIYSSYGMTESGPISISWHSDNEDLISSTVGCVVDHTEIKVVNECNQIVPLGMPGECWVRGPCLMKGYYKGAGSTSTEGFRTGGWFPTGDKIVLLDKGYTKIVGRIKDTIIRGGENIEPVEIESMLASHPDIIDVQVFAVYGGRLIEDVAASIIKRAGSRLSENDVRKYCEGKLAYYKIPKYIEFVQDYSRTASGKIVKLRLRENLERKLNSTVISQM